jgi:hypothetical protein
MRTINIIVFSILLLLFHNITCFAQYKWKQGELSTKEGVYNVEFSESKNIAFSRKEKDPGYYLELGTSPETGMVYINILSAKEMIEIFNEAFSLQKLEMMAKVEKSISLGITINEKGIPIDVNFYIRQNSLVTPDELIYIDREILKRVRYKIRRQKPFGKPCSYSTGARIKFEDIINGEIPALSRSEELGKKKASWEK